MTTVTVTGVALTKKGLAKIKRDIGRTSVLTNRMGRAIRDDARRRITSQGDGSWAPLSKWTRARTGRKKALLAQRSKISFKLIGGKLVIGHDSGAKWTLEQHERGFTTGPEVPALIPLKQPRFLGLPTGQATHLLRSAKPSVVPARRVFANQSEADAILKPITEKWVADIIARSRKVT